MDIHRAKVREFSIATTMERLRKNGMEVAYLPKITDVVPMVRSMLDEGCTIAVGGSTTLKEARVLHLIRSGPYHFIDRYKEGLSSEEKRNTYLDAFRADVYITSVNAITEHGELYCVDGTSNRVAALLYGPEKVIVVAGWQKIVTSLREAVHRVKRVAAPANALRLNKETYCVKKGHCIAPLCDSEHLMSIGVGTCNDGICSNMVVMGRQAQIGRVTVLIVGEAIGY